MTEEHIQIKIMRLLRSSDLRHRDLAQGTGNRNIHWHLQRLASFGYVESEKRNKQTYFSLSDEGINALNQGDFSQIRIVRPFVEVLTRFMASDSYTPMTAKQLREALNDPRTQDEFNSLLAHLMQRGYIISNKNSVIRTCELSARGREYASNPQEYRRKKRHMRYE
jgi:hypothetical protein